MRLCQSWRLRKMAAKIPAAGISTYNAATSDADLGSGVHIKTGDSGGSATSTADELVVEGSGDTGIQILSGASSEAGITFGDSGDSNVGLIGYDHANNRFRFKTNDAVQWYLDSSGNWLPAATDHGIYLGVTSATASNLLDDYEEGNTSDLTLSPGTSGSISLQDGFRQLSYTKVGRLVTITGMLKITSVSSPTGAPTFTLPFVLASNSDTGEIVRGHGYVVNAAAAENGDGGLIIDVQTAGSATASIFKTDNTTNGLRDFDSTFATSQAEINFSFSYFSA
jgi:hypothetical protein